MTIQYDAENMHLSFVVKWGGTIFPLVLRDPLFWILMVVHFVLLHYDAWLLEQRGEGLPELEWNASTTAISLLTFFLVFYGNNCCASWQSSNAAALPRCCRCC